MASISAAGLGSGLDLNSLVSQLVAAERAPTDNRLSRETAKINAEISALGAITSSATGLKNALTALASGTAFGSRTATSTSSVFTASATSSAGTGSYQVRVESLATAQKLASGPVASANDPVGSGELSISLGTDTFVLIFDPAASINEIRDAINEAESNPGIRATVLNSADGARLILSSDATGSANNIQVTAAGGDGGLTVLVYEAGGTQNLSELTPAQDAEAYIDGFLVTSAGNQISGAVEGLTINLVSAEPGVTHILNVSNNNDPTVAAVENFIGRYNAFVATAATVTRYDALNRQAASLVGDPAIRSLNNRLRSLVGGELTNPNGPTLLSEIGIKISKDGTLTLDKTVFNEAIAGNPQGLKSLFTGAEAGGDGLADTLATLLNSYVGTSGVFTSRNESVKERLSSIDTQRAALNRRMASYQARYQKQFSALDIMISQLQSTGNFLTQQLSNIQR